MPVDHERRRVLFLGAASIALGGAAFGCQKSPPATCPQAKLTPAEEQVRKTLAYVDRTPDPSKPCVKCLQYVPAAEADQCGGCKLMKGPIHPKGYCTAFAPL